MRTQLITHKHRRVDAKELAHLNSVALDAPALPTRVEVCLRFHTNLRDLK